MSGDRLDFAYVMLKVGQAVEQREDTVKDMLKKADAAASKGSGGADKTDGTTPSNSNGLDNPATAAKLQYEVSKWNSLLGMQTAMVKEIGDSLKGITQKIN
jgi:hypothetical protein